MGLWVGGDKILTESLINTPRLKSLKCKRRRPRLARVVSVLIWLSGDQQISHSLATEGDLKKVT